MILDNKTINCIYFIIVNIINKSCVLYVCIYIEDLINKKSQYKFFKL